MLKNYRKRLKQQGIAQFEVLGLDADRELIRSLARRLADDGPDSARIRATVCLAMSGEQPENGGILKALCRSPRPSCDAGPVSRWLLDTNIIGNVTKPVRSERLGAWLAGQAAR